MRPIRSLTLSLVLVAATMPAVAGTLTDPATGATCTNGQDVLITRDDFRLVLDGVCGKVTIRASKGSLNVDEVTSIQVIGSGVTVLNQKVGTLMVEGSNNMLNMTDVGEAIVAGDNNTLLGNEVGRVHFRGNGNTVNASNRPDTVDDGSSNRVM